LGAEGREKELSEDYAGLGDEEVSERLVKYRPRYRKIVDELKEKYGNRCQVQGCGFTFRKKNGDFYSEGHHLIPLSEGGKQEASNVVILCPNHHMMLHYADIEVGEREGEKRELKINRESHFVIY
jgi:predicted restriction endonuclease